MNYISNLSRDTRCSILTSRGRVSPGVNEAFLMPPDQGPPLARTDILFDHRPMVGFGGGGGEGVEAAGVLASSVRGDGQVAMQEGMA